MPGQGGGPATDQFQRDSQDFSSHTATEPARQRGEAAAEATSTETGKPAFEDLGTDKVLLANKEGQGTRVVEVSKLTREDKKDIVERVLESHDQDAERFYQKLRQRQERVGMAHSSVEVRFEDLRVTTGVYVGSRALPTVINSYRNFVEDLLIRFKLLRGNKRNFVILDSISGVIKPGRITLLLGPPGAGKTTLLTALSGKLQGVAGLKTTGQITYNGQTFKQFLPERTASYIDQNDNHYPELTVRETLDFAARCMGIGTTASELEELRRLEKEHGIEPDWEIDAFMKAAVRMGKREHINTELILKLLALDVCSETPIGNQMIRGVSGGQRKRVTTGEMIVGPKRAFFMDEISTGLDSSNTFQIVRSIRDFAHLRDATVFMALLQPAPETFDLFDDIFLLSEGHVIYHGPREDIMAFFEGMGFRLPERKGVPDFLQEVTSRKDQQQYWHGKGAHKYIGVAHFAKAYRESGVGRRYADCLAAPYEAPNERCMQALMKKQYALPAYKRFKALMRREYTLVMRTIFIYKFKTAQVVIMALVSATLFLRTHIHPVSPNDGNEIAGFLFFSTLIMLFNGIAEMSMTVERLSVFHKQRNNHFYDAFSFVTPSTCFRLPYSLLEAVAWTVITYFPVGLAGEPGRFFMFLLLLFLLHSWSVALFRLIGGLSRNIIVANAIGSLAMLGVFLMGGFVIAKPQIHPWVVWIYWANPLAYCQRGLIINEFTAGHWQDKRYPYDTSLSLGDGIMKSRGFQNHYWWVWVGVGVLILGNILFNILIVAAHAYLPPWGSNKAVVSDESLHEREIALHGEDADVAGNKEGSRRERGKSKEFEMTQQSLQGGMRANGSAQDGQGQGLGALEEGQAAPALSSRPERAGGGPVGPAGPEQGFDRVTSHPLESLQPSRQPSAPDLAQGGEPAAQPPSGSRRSLGGRWSGRRRSGAGGSRRSLDGNAGASQRGMGSWRSGSRREISGKGMVLPFEPMTMTFSDVHYYVEIPKEAAQGREMVTQEGKAFMLELLQGISGAFRPGVLTCLMGVSGAGKTTLMDVLSDRKTGGRITGDVRINGHPKEAASFARISGYVEQFDIHSSQTTVREALLFSAQLRTKYTKTTTRELVDTFVDEVMALVELDPLREVLVGKPGMSGLSVEQRKRLTIAVELVANPSIVFMDEPTSGLDARAAAIVMRTVRNIVNTGRTIVCTIHQPSIDIFESFDELLLLKRGGETIYNGKLGKDSADLIKYFSAVEGVPSIRDGLNPATWMLEVTTPGMEKRLGVSFAEVYKKSSLARRYEAVIQENSQPKEGSSPIRFDTRYSKSIFEQLIILTRRTMTIYFRTPEYNGVRFFFAVCIGLLFGAIFWQLGQDTGTQLGLFNVLGALYATTLFFGIINSIVVQPVISDERAVSYRETAAGMYSIFPWTLAIGITEIVYVLVQSVLYVCVLYWMCGFLSDPRQFFWFLLFMVLTLIYFTFYGVLAIAVTPNIKLAAVISSNFYALWNLFAGFVIQLPNMPGWWKWYFYLDPVAWTVWGLVSGQVGDRLDDDITLPSGQSLPVAVFVRQSFGYRHDWLGWVVIICVGWCLVFFFLAFAGFRYLNFLKR